jgi:enoyl-CoA hydratase
MDLKNIIFQKKGATAYVTINRPQVMNALNHDVLMELQDVRVEIEKNNDIRIMILRGAGDKSFVAGFDIGDLASQGADVVIGRANSRIYQSVLDGLEGMGKPSIAAVNGFAFGGGLELAMACTMRVASENAKFGLPEVSLGMLPGFGGTQRLPRLAGKGIAAQMILTAKPIDASEAFRVGLVNAVVPLADLMNKADEIAQTILKNGTVAVSLAMELITRGPEMSLEDAMALESALAGISLGLPDTQARLRAFVEKTK